MLKLLPAVAIIAFALVAVSCGGGDGADDFELPPPAEYRLAVSGTVEVEFPAEGVSAAALTLQQSVTGEVSGGLTSTLTEDGTLTIRELGLTIKFREDTIQIIGGARESTGNTEPDGTDISLQDLCAVQSEPIPEVPQLQCSQDPIPLHSPDPLDEGITLTTPSDFEGGAFVAPGGTRGFDVNSMELTVDGLMPEEPFEASCQQPGDVNGDGEINSVDAALILQFDAGLIASLPCEDPADVNGDGEVSSIDAALILQFNAGLIESFPASPTSTPAPATDTPVPGVAPATNTPAPSPTGGPATTTYTDPTGDEVVVGGGSDAAVDIRNVTISASGGQTKVLVTLGSNPSLTLDFDFSFAVRVTLGGQVGLVEVHADSDNSAPPAGGSVNDSKAGVSIVFNKPVPSGATLLVETFHLEAKDSAFGMDTFTVMLP